MSKSLAVAYLRTLAYVADGVRSGPIRRAAERLSVSLSALTRQLQDVEQGFGAAIFE